MMHVSILPEISSELDEIFACTLQHIGNTVRSSIMHVVSDNPNFDFIVDDFVENCKGNILVCEGEHTDLKLFFGLVNEVNDLLLVSLVREEYYFAVHFLERRFLRGCRIT